MENDAQLLRRYADEKSETAFAELVRRHLDLVYSAALRRLGGDAHHAADVAQQVFTTLARDGRKLSRHGVLTAWLYTATRNAAVDLIRAEQRRHTREQEASTMQQLFSAAPDADWARLRPVLDGVMDELSETDRTAVLLRFFEKRPFSEVGAALQLSEDAARMRVERALDKLRVLLARRGVTSTAAALTSALANQAMVAAPAGLAATITGVAVTTGAATAATGFFMNTTNLIASAVTVVAVGVAVLQVDQTHRAETELAAITQDRDGLRAQLRDVQQRTTAAEQQRAAAEQQNAALQSDLATTRAAKAAAETTARPEAWSGRQLISTRNSDGTLTIRPSPVPIDPAEVRRLARESNVQGMDITYRAFYRQAGFTPAQNEQFKAFMLDSLDRREALAQAAVIEATAPGSRPDRTAMQSALEASAKPAHDELLMAMRGAFGEATVQTYQHYVDTIAGREVTRELSSALFYTDTPLTAVQADQLVEVVAANSRNGAGRVELAAMNNDAILVQAQTILSAPQLAALRKTALEVRQKWALIGGK